MSEIVLSERLLRLVDDWVDLLTDKSNGLTSRDISFDGSSPQVLMGILAALNYKSIKLEKSAECLQLSLLCGRVFDACYKTVFANELERFTVSSMIDATKVSILHSYQILLKREQQELHGCGAVYFLLDEDAGLIKIGWSINLNDRVRGLVSQSGRDLKLVGFIRSDSQKSETKMHRRFKRLRKRGEWFEYKDELIDFVEAQFGGTRQRWLGEG